MAENKEENKNTPKENAQNKAPQNQSNKTIEARTNGPPKNTQNKAKEILHNRQIYIEKKKPEDVRKDAGAEGKGSNSNTLEKEQQQQLHNQEKDNVSVQNRFTVLEIEETQDEDEVEEIQMEEEPTKIIVTPKQMNSRKTTYSSMPPDLQHLLKNTESFSKNFRKKCALSMNLTDIDKPRDNNTPTILELKEFIASMPNFKVTENKTVQETREVSDEVKENNEDNGQISDQKDGSEEEITNEDKGIQRRKNYQKNPEHQRNLRSSVIKLPQTSNTCKSNV